MASETKYEYVVLDETERYTLARQQLLRVEREMYQIEVRVNAGVEGVSDRDHEQLENLRQQAETIKSLMPDKSSE